MKLQNSKRGFTIVELVIVIAVIAILASVILSIMTAVVEKAERSKDIQTIRNLNTAVIADAQLSGLHKTLYDAGQAALDAGYNVEKILGERTHIGWDSKNDRFVYIEDNGKIVYTPDDKNIEQIPEVCVDIFKIYQNKSIAASEYSGKKCSIYAGEHWPDGPVSDLDVGFDAGSHTNISSVSYSHSGDNQNVVIRTNSTETALTVYGPSDDVKHYGIVGDLIVTAVRPTHCYHEWGFVENLVSFGTGKFVVESTALFHQTKAEVAAKFEGKTDSYVEGKDPQYTQHIYDENGTCVVDGCHETTETHAHSWGEYAHDVTNHWRICASCGATETAAAHTFDAGSITKAATCTETGTRKFTCTACKYEKTEEIAALGHDFQWVVDTPATKTSEGEKHEKCSRCDETRNPHTVIPAEPCDHMTKQKVDKVAATCTTAGAKEYWYCQECNKNFEDEACQLVIENVDIWKVIPALGHSYGAVTYTWNEQECTATRVCARDDNHIETETVAGVYVKNTDATCTACEKGHYEATFTNSAFVKQNTADGSVDKGTALGHDFTSMAHDEYQHWNVCSKCSATDTKVAHTLTYTNDGEMHTENCETCGYTKSGLAHEFTNGVCVCGKQEVTEIIRETKYINSANSYNNHVLTYNITSTTISSYDVAPNICLELATLNGNQSTRTWMNFAVWEDGFILQAAGSNAAFSLHINDTTGQNYQMSSGLLGDSTILYIVDKDYKLERNNSGQYFFTKLGQQFENNEVSFNPAPLITTSDDFKSYLASIAEISGYTNTTSSITTTNVNNYINAYKNGTLGNNTFTEYLKKKYGVGDLRNIPYKDIISDPETLSHGANSYYYDKTGIAAGNKFDISHVEPELIQMLYYSFYTNNMAFAFFEGDAVTSNPGLSDWVSFINSGYEDYGREDWMQHYSTTNMKLISCKDAMATENPFKFKTENGTITGCICVVWNQWIGTNAYQGVDFCVPSVMNVTFTPSD